MAQSLSRKIKRGNAIIRFNLLSNQKEVVERKGFSGNWRKFKQKEEMILAGEDFCNSVTKPISSKQIKESKERVIFNIN